MGLVVLAASAVVLGVIALVLPEHKEIHTMLCRQWQNETFAGKNGQENMTYCPECGLKLSRLEKD